MPKSRKRIGIERRRKINFRLSEIIRRSGIKQYVFADQIQVDPNRLSKIINGHLEPDDSEKLKIARSIGLKVDDLFGNVAEDEESKGGDV